MVYEGRGRTAEIPVDDIGGEVAELNAGGVGGLRELLPLPLPLRGGLRRPALHSLLMRKGICQCVTVL